MLKKTSPTDDEDDASKENKSKLRRLEGSYLLLAKFLSITITGLIFYTAFWGTFASAVQRAISLLFLLPLTFLYYPPSKKPWAQKVHWVDIIAIVLSIVVFGWIIINWKALQWRTWYVNPLTATEIIFGTIAILLVIEATRRTFGLFLPILTVIFIGYMMFGSLTPGTFHHSGASYEMMVEHLYLVPEGMFNFLTGILATLLFTFLALGTFLRVSGADTLFLDFCVAVAGHRAGRDRSG